MGSFSDGITYTQTEKSILGLGRVHYGQGPTGTRYPTRTRNIFQYPIRTRLIFKIIGYFGYRVLEKNQVFDMNP